jgi:hypothetical protein
MLLEFRKFVQKEDPPVGQGDFAGPGILTAADKTGIGYGVVG